MDLNVKSKQPNYNLYGICTGLFFRFVCVSGNALSFIVRVESESKSPDIKPNYLIYVD